MPSNALNALLASIPEVDDLLGAQKPLPPLQRSTVGRAIRRASTVALSSHFERYLYVLNEEAVDVVNGSGIHGDQLPESLRLYHSKSAVELLAETAWERNTRSNALETFVKDEAWLWSLGMAGHLNHERLLEFMSAPRPDEIRRYFRYWDIPDIFNAITRTPHVRTKLYVKLVELVDKRNGIAHGDVNIVPTYHDVISYRGVVKAFCTRTDRAIARQIDRMTGAGRPW